MNTHDLTQDAIGLGTTTKGDQWLTFMLDAQEYGIDILRVQEIKGWTPTTSIPNTPQHVRGVINLRGTIVPVVDLRSQFAMEEVEYTKFTVVIVVSVLHRGTERIMGIVVDAVSDVYDVRPDDLQPTPDMGDAVDTRFIRGIATVNDRMVIALDVDRLLDGQALHQDLDMTMVEEAATETVGASPAHS